MKRLTLKQQKFIEAYARCGVLRKAARQAGYSEKTVLSGGIMRSPAVRAALEKLQAEAMTRAGISLASLLDELEAARCLAMEKQTPASAVSASMGKARLLGLDKPKGDKETEDEGIEAENVQVLVQFI